MTTPEQERATQPRSSEGSESIALPIALLILAFILGAASLTLIVFGVWPAVLLLIACTVMASVAVRKIRKSDAPNV